MITGGAVLVALLAQGTTGAAPGATPTMARLEVRGPADCASRSDLAARVAARSSRIQFADDAPIDASVVFISVRPANVVAEVALGAAGAEPSSRRVVARSCAEAADAIAVIIVVTLDPTSNGQHAAGAPPSSAAEPTEQPPVTTKPAALAAVDSTSATPRSSATETRRAFGAYLAGQTFFGPAPNVMPGVALYVMASLNRDGRWAPALFIGATHVWRDDLAEADGNASFTLDAASLDACPVRLGGSRLAVRPCASLLVGRMAARGSSTDKPASSARPFGATGAALTAGVGLGAAVELTARVGIGATVLRDAYQLGSTTFYRAERVTAAASLGIGAHWP